MTKIANKALKTKDYEEYSRNFSTTLRGGPSLVFAGMHVTSLATALLISMLNLVSVILKFPKTMHLYGLFVVVVIAIPASVFFLAPTDRKKYLQDFEEFESRSLGEKRKWALITLSIILGIWIICILSFVVFFRSLPR
ncbi:MAG: hypothetical protein IPK98_11315 [Chloracidobacterium sp.]|nr:hypothetical protein [Chloracidobacterium sp.]